MYASFYISNDKIRSWFSVNIDADLEGREMMVMLAEGARKIATEAVNINRFDTARKYLNFSEEIAKALEHEAVENNAEAKDAED